MNKKLVMFVLCLTIEQASFSLDIKSFFVVLFSWVSPKQRAICDLGNAMKPSFFEHGNKLGCSYAADEYAQCLVDDLAPAMLAQASLGYAATLAVQEERKQLKEYHFQISFLDCMNRVIKDR